MSGPRLFFLAALLAVLLATFTRTFIVQGLFIPTGSMRPTLIAGDHILVGKLLYQPPRNGFLAALRPSREVRRYDVLIFRSPGNPSVLRVKRCIGLPGELIAFKESVVWIDGRRLKADPHVYSPIGEATNALPSQGVRVPQGHYFVLGDNRSDSSDSRDLGPIPHSALVGRALLVYWSFRPPPAKGEGTPWRSIRALAATTRWARTFLPIH